jgi:hypothetical protein
MSDSHGRPDARIAVSRGIARIEVEGTEKFVREQLAELLPIVVEASPGATQTDSTGADAPGAAAATTETRSMPTTVRGFFQQKKPSTAYEAIGCALYYAQRQEGKEELSVTDIRTMLTQANYRPPASFAQALSDCRRKYGYAETGTKRSMWKLTSQGGILVQFDLPRPKEG